MKNTYLIIFLVVLVMTVGCMAIESRCPNGICEHEENCEMDCGPCGDGMCQGIENTTSCPQDCISWIYFYKVLSITNYCTFFLYWLGAVGIIA